MLEKYKNLLAEIKQIDAVLSKLPQRHIYEAMYPQYQKKTLVKTRQYYDYIKSLVFNKRNLKMQVSGLFPSSTPRSEGYFLNELCAKRRLLLRNYLSCGTVQNNGSSAHTFRIYDGHMSFRSYLYLPKNWQPEPLFSVNRKGGLSEREAALLTKKQTSTDVYGIYYEITYYCGKSYEKKSANAYRTGNDKRLVIARGKTKRAVNNQCGQRFAKAFVEKAAKI